MRLAVFSDLHLGPAPSNRCTASQAELLELFDHIEACSDRVLVGGDLFDLDRPKRPGAWRAVLAGVRDELPRAVERMDNYEWIFGNHDGQLCRAGVPEEREYRADGLRLIARHGHQWDMGLKKLPGLAPAANFVAGWLDRSGLDNVADALGGAPLVLDRLWHTQNTSQPGPDRSLRGARNSIVRERIDVLICGHSHLLRLVATEGGLFVNTGSICRGFVDWVLVDTAEASVRAFRDGVCVQEARREAHRWIVEGLSPDQR